MVPTGEEHFTSSLSDLDRLIAEWDRAWSEGPSIEVPVLDGSIVTAFLHLAWSHHVVRLSRAVIKLYETEMYAEAVPLVRQTLETGISAIWAAHTDQAGDRAYASHLLHRRTMLRDMEQVGLPTTDALTELSSEIDELERSRGSIQKYCMPSLYNRTQAFSGGKDLYVHYRGLSEYAHPTFWLADGYAHATSGAPPSIALSASPRYDQQRLAMDYQLVSVSHTLSSWASIPSQASRYKPLVAELDRIGEAHGFKPVRYPTRSEQ